MMPLRHPVRYAPSEFFPDGYLYPAASFVSPAETHELYRLWRHLKSRQNRPTPTAPPKPAHRSQQNCVLGLPLCHVGVSPSLPLATCASCRGSQHSPTVMNLAWIRRASGRVPQIMGMTPYDQYFSAPAARKETVRRIADDTGATGA